MTTTTKADRVSRPFSTEPSVAQQALMHALSEWLNANRDSGMSWDAAETLVGAFMRAARFGDSTCDGRHEPGHGYDVINYPVALRLDRGSWLARYECRKCGHRYSCGWGDDPIGLW